jgi:hypothetical protein
VEPLEPVGQAASWDVGWQQQPAPESFSSRFEAVEVVLTPRQAAVGGRLELYVPVQSICPRCRGTGGTGLWACSTCRGQGSALREIPVAFDHPPGLVNGTLVQVPLDGVGLPGAALLVRFRIREF